MNRSLTCVLAVFSMGLLMGLLGGEASAQEEVLIKLGTMAPQNSPWHMLLKEGAQKFQEISGGKVKLRIFAGGTMGNEGDMVKKIRIGQLQAAALTSIGLHEIVKDVQVIDMPMLIQDREEKDYVLGKIEGRLEQALMSASQPMVVLNWSEIGFVRFFTTRPRPTLAEMRKSKLFAWEGDPASVDAWKAGGFNPVVLSATDIIPSLQTGMIDAVAYPPTVALGIRLHQKARYMTDLIWSPLTGALVVDRKTWESIPRDLQPKLMKVARDLGRRTIEMTRQFEADALNKMKIQGLEVVRVTDAPEWRKAVENIYPAIRGKVVPAAIFDEVQRLVKEYRATQANKKGS